MNISQSTASIHQNAHLDLQRDHSEHIDFDKICPGCKLSAVSDDGGLVVAFGQSFFHVDCFKCAKCGDKVTADTNLLLLSDGSPVCANCSYNCNVCKLPILDEAIMTGDDSYHAHCFKCKVCKNRIDELVFAKTSQGIYCMDCHSERMIKIRRHAQKKAERERAAAAGGNSSSSSRETRYRRDTEPDTHHHSDLSHRRPPLVRQLSTLSEQSFEQETAASRPMNLSSQPSSDGLSVQTSRRDKRRSINPGLTLSNLTSSVSPAASPPPTLSPHSVTFLHQSGNRSPTPPTHNGRESPRIPSPLREHFNEAESISRPSSNGSFQSTTSHIRPGSSSSHYNHSDDDASSLRTRTFSAENPSSDVRVGETSTPRVRKLSSPNPTHSLEKPIDAVRHQRSFDERPREHLSSSPTLTFNRVRSSSPSRASSRADVPHSVESSTDTEAEGDEPTAHKRSESSTSVPPALPPKSEKNVSPIQPPSEAVSPTSEADPDTSNQMDSGSDDMSESSPVEQTSHATFIAPALPPIRFSLNTGDFSDLLSSVGGINALKSLDQLTSITEKHKESNYDIPSTPPPPSTATSSTSIHERESSESHPESLQTLNASMPEFNGSQSSGRIALATPGANLSSVTRPDDSDFVLLRLQEAMADAKERGAQQLKLDRAFVEAIIKAMDVRRANFFDLKGKFDGVKRASKQYIEGLTVAQTEYDRELKARRDAEAEVTRLRVLLSGQAARLTALSGDSRRQELRQRMTKELHDQLSGLEQDLSKLKVDRDMALAEVEEISATKSLNAAADQRPTHLNRSLTMRLDTLKQQYQRDLVPLTHEREALSREIMELKAVRDVFLEETTVLNARNEELAQLSAQYARRMDTVPETPSKNGEHVVAPSTDKGRNQLHQPQISVQLPSQNPYASTTSLVTDETTADMKTVIKISKPEIDLPTPSKGKFIKWPGSRTKDTTNLTSAGDSRSKGHLEHNFQQLSVLRFTRCDHCGDKMWGSQLRCTGCNISVHVRCINHVQVLCSQQSSNRDESQILPHSMFGRDLVEQVYADAKGGSRQVPVIVDKCIEAVEAIALDYEGIYRKTGGSSQSKTITQLFERGDYNAFDLRDSDRFNDICSVTSVLKAYFRSLPVPLLTYDLHDQFMSAVEIRDASVKNKTLLDLVNKLPKEHYHTLRALMIHLNKVCQRSERNLMNARNLGVVFGPTLMRSRNPGAEFSDMAGKALSIEWLVENAPQIYAESASR
ncbi:signal transducer [Armillaria luteobubalina]|uniref:Signal transducer n=1 Tax=Armillaria luteobubalina TaxID=153913 RepID=A0AA39QMV6_9AGAR|nr:signal transducer [Armillaria luteobubalina]